MEQTCRRCGCGSFHYNRARMRMECDSCAAPLGDDQQDQRQMRCDRTYAQALRHLSVGNWKQAMTLLWPLMEEQPGEKRLYLAVLRAATKDFQDVSMENASDRATASDVWNKLVRLRAVTPEMLRYAGRRYAWRREALLGRRNRTLAWLFAAALCSVLAGVLFEASLPLLGAACVGGALGSLYLMSLTKPVEVIRALLRPAPEGHSDPFGAGGQDEEVL